MKKLLLIPAFIFCGFTGFAQISDFIPGGNTMQILTMEKTPTGYTGSPYVENDFTQGVIMDENGKSQPAYLRYNTVEDVVEIKMNKGEKETFVLPKITNLTYQLNGYTYVLDKLQTNEGKRLEGYFIKYHDGEKVKFYGRPMPDVTEAQPARTGYGKDKPAHLSVNMEYYITNENGVLQNVRIKEKDIKNALPSSSAIDQYLSENKVKSVEDVKRMLQWYETQA